MEVMLYQEPSQDAAAAAAQDHLWVAVAAVAAVAAGEGAEGTIKEHLGFQSFLLWPADASSRCLSKEND